MPKSKPLPPLAELQEVLSYDPETGVFRWKVAPCKNMPAGHVAGGHNGRGYLRVKHGGGFYLCHRLAWLFVHGQDPEALEVDHANGNKMDNRIANLRLAVHAENQHNSRIKAHNKSGYKGVYQQKGKSKWYAEVKFHKARYSKGGFASPAQAYEWACAMRESLHARFANHGAGPLPSAMI